MGLDPAPFLANLFLAYYEIHFIDRLRKTDYCRTKKFLNTYRFIDDLTPLDDNGEFDRSKSEIYPQELECKKENDGLLDATFLVRRLSDSVRRTLIFGSVSLCLCVCLSYPFIPKNRAIDFSDFLHET